MAEPIYRVYPMALCESLGKRSVLFTGVESPGDDLWYPVFSWYIEGASRPILVDTGGPAHEMTMCSRRGLPARDIMSLEDALAAHGLRIGDIEVVIQTHLHYDHCVNTRHLVNARVYVQRAELETVLNRDPPISKGYPREWLDSINFVSMEGDYALEPGIQVLHVPGHTPGTQAIAINTEKGRAVISGFCSVYHNFQPELAGIKDGEILPPCINIDPDLAMASARRVRELADIILPNHEPSLKDCPVI